MLRAMLCATALTLCFAGTAAAQEIGREDPLLAPVGTCPGDANPDAHHRTQRLAMHCLLAHLRRKAELPALRSNVSLRHSAIYKARRIAECKTFTHNPCGDALDEPFRRAQVTRHGRWLVGEDLAWGKGRTATARSILQHWLDSPTHRDVLLTRRFSHVGLRRRRLKMDGAPRGAVLWVAHVGRPAAR